MARVHSNGCDIYYECYGEGFPLILAHGAGGNAACWWQQIPYFADRFRVIAFDHRGFARSRVTSDNFDVAYFANDLRAILDKECIEEAHLVCQSMGGWTGLNLAIESPERVRSLTMSHTPGGIATEQTEKIRKSLYKTRMPLESPWSHWALADDYHLRNRKSAHLYNQISSFNTEIDMDRLGNMLFKPFDLSRLSQLTTPVLFITGSRERVFPAEMIRKVAELVPGSRVEEIEGAGHSSYFETPDVFNHLVNGFISDK